MYIKKALLYGKSFPGVGGGWRGGSKLEPRTYVPCDRRNQSQIRYASPHVIKHTCHFACYFDFFYIFSEKKACKVEAVLLVRFTFKDK